MTMMEVATLGLAGPWGRALLKPLPTPPPGQEPFQVRWVARDGKAKMERFASEAQAYERFAELRRTGGAAVLTLVERSGRGWVTRSTATRRSRPTAGRRAVPAQSTVGERSASPAARHAVLARTAAGRGRGLTPAERAVRLDGPAARKARQLRLGPGDYPACPRWQPALSPVLPRSPWELSTLPHARGIASSDARAAWLRKNVGYAVPARR
ncbi:MAG: hypothetical protein ACRD0S_01510 [Acidimicrobiales bacterium]